MLKKLKLFFFTTLMLFGVNEVGLNAQSLTHSQLQAKKQTKDVKSVQVDSKDKMSKEELRNFAQDYYKNRLTDLEQQEQELLAQPMTNEIADQLEGIQLEKFFLQKNKSSFSSNSIKNKDLRPISLQKSIGERYTQKNDQELRSDGTPRKIIKISQGQAKENKPHLQEKPGKKEGVSKKLTN